VFGQQAATGYYHDYSGYVVFLVGVLLMVQAGEVDEGKKEEGRSNSNRKEGGRRKERRGRTRNCATLNAQTLKFRDGVVCGVCGAVLAVFAARLTSAGRRV
jgi:hypothetical protein